MSFEPVVVPSVSKPELLPAWRAVWDFLQARLALPLGCLWSTQWLHSFLPSLPDLLVVEVNWAEVNQAGNLLRSYLHSDSSAIPAPASLSPAGLRVVLRPWQRYSPVRRVKGIPVARPEKMLVDAGQLPELSAFVTDATLGSALTAMFSQRALDPQVLLRYAAQCHASARWTTILRHYDTH
ncbi:DUF6577 family protein [Hymenobacter busanensis]